MAIGRLVCSVIVTSVLIFAQFLLETEAATAVIPASENFTRVWNDLMKKPYDKRIRPLYGENALFIRVSFNLETILDVNEPASELRVRIVFRQTWLEPRLTFSPGMVPNDTVQLNVDQAKLLWLPDTIFNNQKRSERQEGHESILLTAEGLITTSSRILLTTDCPMHYDHFPFDVQTCTIKIGSYSQDNRQLIYEWSWSPGEVRVEPTPLVFNRFDLLSYDTQTLSLAGASNRSILSVLSIRLHLSSNWRNYLTTFFTPMIFFTAISLLTRPLFTPALRILINILNIALMNIFVLILVGEEERPVVSHRTCMDQYVSLCFFFVFASLLVDLVNVYFERHPLPVETEAEEEEVCGLPLEPKQGVNDEEIGIDEGEDESQEERKNAGKTLAANFRKARNIAQSICERHASWILVIGFLGLNALYWIAHTSLQTNRAQRIARI